MAIAFLIADSDWGHMGDWGVGWWILMVLMMAIFWGLVIVGVAWLARSLSGQRETRERGPLEVLEHRLAAGEISPEEYKERRAVIEGRS